MEMIKHDGSSSVDEYGYDPATKTLRVKYVSGPQVYEHANVEAAHQVTRGEGITIAIIDNGVDIDHPEFGGAGKLVAQRDATLQTDDPRPKDIFGTGPDERRNAGDAARQDLRSFRRRHYARHRETVRAGARRARRPVGR
jgi:subtilisin family serine protease